MQLPKILALADDITPLEYTIESDICAIGRSPSCHIVISINTVSRLHAKIERDDPRYILCDANSANGTYVNGQRIYEPHLLKDQDLIGLSTSMALLRFEDPDTTIPLFSLDGLHYDKKTMTFFLKQQQVNLTPTQFRLLHHLYQHAGSICTRKSCAEAIWGRNYDPGLDAAALDRAMSNLRRKLRQIAPKADLIETRHGLGYILNLSGKPL